MSTHQPTPAGTPNVTAILADWIIGLQGTDIPEQVRKEGLRTFVNWLGCAIGGATHETVDIAIRALAPFSGAATSSLPGRSEKLDALHAALINGISSHVLDYDDTHLKTIIHPAGPVASALLALAETRPMSGYDFLTALIVGVEVECRIGNSVYPEHYDRGWHITGTTGVFGAAAAVGKAIGLDRTRMLWALGIAGTQASNLREMFGTMTKSFHPGRAAQNGLTAALLAEAGYDSSERVLEAPRGFACVLSEKQDWDEIIGDLGARWEAALNSYKPFACGIVIHPSIDACVQLHDAGKIRIEDIETVSITAHPLVLELTGKTEPATGLESKFSVFHAAAYALLHGDGGPNAFTDSAATDSAVVALRRRVKVKTTAECHSASVKVEVVLRDGTTVEQVVDRAVGSVDVPLTDEQLDRKFIGQAADVMGEEKAAEVLAIAWKTPELQTVAEVAALARVIS